VLGINVDYGTVSILDDNTD